MNPISLVNMRRAKLAIWAAVLAPVRCTAPDSVRLPQNLPIVPACVLSRPAFHSPLHSRSSITCSHRTLTPGHVCNALGSAHSRDTHLGCQGHADTLQDDGACMHMQALSATSLHCSAVAADYTSGFTHVYSCATHEEGPQWVGAVRHQGAASRSHKDGGHLCTKLCIQLATVHQPRIFDTLQRRSGSGYHLGLHEHAQ